MTQNAKSGQMVQRINSVPIAGVLDPGPCVSPSKHTRDVAARMGSLRVNRAGWCLHDDCFSLGTDRVKRRTASARVDILN